jgi:hypothetical protein
MSWEFHVELGVDQLPLPNRSSQAFHVSAKGRGKSGLVTSVQGTVSLSQVQNGASFSLTSFSKPCTKSGQLQRKLNSRIWVRYFYEVYYILWCVICLASLRMSFWGSVCVFLWQLLLSKDIVHCLVTCSSSCTLLVVQYITRISSSDVRQMCSTGTYFQLHAYAYIPIRSANFPPTCCISSFWRANCSGWTSMVAETSWHLRGRRMWKGHVCRGGRWSCAATATAERWSSRQRRLPGPLLLLAHASKDWLDFCVPLHSSLPPRSCSYRR